MDSWVNILYSITWTIHDYSIVLRNHHAVDAVYFDFAEAFDSVSHSKLLHKLAAYGIAG